MLNPRKRDDLDLLLKILNQTWIACAETNFLHQLNEERSNVYAFRDPKLSIFLNSSLVYCSFFFSLQVLRYFKHIFGTLFPTLPRMMVYQNMLKSSLRDIMTQLFTTRLNIFEVNAEENAAINEWFWTAIRQLSVLAIDVIDLTFENLAWVSFILIISTIKFLDPGPFLKPLIPSDKENHQLKQEKNVIFERNLCYQWLSKIKYIFIFSNFLKFFSFIIKLSVRYWKCEIFLYLLEHHCYYMYIFQSFKFIKQ